MPKSIYCWKELSDGDRIRFEFEVQNSVPITQFLPQTLLFFGLKEFTLQDCYGTASKNDSIAVNGDTKNAATFRGLIRRHRPFAEACGPIWAKTAV
jgi:hypothetical protein